MWILKVLAFLWPFIKEMVLGDKTLKEAIKDNKKKVLLALMILASIGLNFFAISRLVVVSKDFVVLQKKHVAATKSIEELTAAMEKSIKTGEPVAAIHDASDKPNTPDEVAAEVPVKKPKPAPVKVVKKSRVKDNANTDRYSKMKDHFDKIKEQEEKAGL